MDGNVNVQLPESDLPEFRIEQPVCPRCGGPHAELLLKRLQRTGTLRAGTTGPVIADTRYWAMCPTYYEPILFHEMRAGVVTYELAEPK